METKNYKVGLHVIQGYPFANPNSDENGSPKSGNFGGVKRGYISSQCKKNVMRKDAGQFKIPLSMRTREVYKYVLETAMGDEFIAETVKDEAKGKVIEKGVRELIKNVYGIEQKAIEEAPVLEEGQEEGKKKSGGKSKKAKKNKGEGAEDRNDCIISLSLQEVVGIIVFIKDHFDEFAKDDKEIAKFMKDQNKWIATNIVGLALDHIAFGRLMAKNPNRNVEAMCNLSFWFTVNECQEQYDFFCATDDFMADGGGSAHMGIKSYNDGLYYGFMAIDLFDGSKQMTEEELMLTFNWLVKTFICSNPKGRSTTMAALTRPFFVRMEIVEDSMPYSYADTFRQVITKDHEREAVCRFLKTAEGRIHGMDDFDLVKVAVAYNYIESDKAAFCDGFEYSTSMSDIFNKAKDFLATNMFVK